MLLVHIYDCNIIFIKHVQGLDYPSGMPMGPQNTFIELFKQIDPWAKDPATSGGAFAVTKHITDQPSKYQGPCQQIVCDRIDKPCTSNVGNASGAIQHPQQLQSKKND